MSETTPVRADIRARLIAAIAAEPRIYVAHDLASAADGVRLGADLGIDSVGMLYIVMAMEDTFDLAVEDAEEVAEIVETWGGLLDYIEARGA